MGNEYNLLTGALMVFHEFCDKNSELEFTYDFHAKEYEELKNRYRLEELLEMVLK